MIKIAVIGLGGFAGAIFRYLLSGAVHSLLHASSFPIGTMIVNVIGCFLIGFGGGLIESRQFFSPELRAFLFVGILGSFTTFSTFGLETFNLVKNGQWLASAGNIGFSIVFGLLAVLVGNMASRLL